MALRYKFGADGANLIMTNKEILQMIETEYKNKQRKSQIQRAKRKKELYEKYADLEILDDKINQIYLAILKNSLNQNEVENKELNGQLKKLQNEKNNYIAKNKIDIGDFALHYQCDICKDTGTILKDGKSQKCSCFINRYNTLAYENTNMLELTKKINFDNFRLDIFDDKILYGKYTQMEFMRKIRDKSFSFIDNIDNPDEKSMIFYGPTGVGKTFLCLCIADKLMKKRKNVVYESAKLMFDTIEQYVFSREKHSSPQSIFYSIVKSCDLLIIDDLGTEITNSFIRQELFEIVNQRIISGKKTIISTNLSQQELQERYEQRIFSRFSGSYNVYKFVGKDLRMFS